MQSTRMLQEIWDQPQVLAKVFDNYGRQSLKDHETLGRKNHLFLVGTGASLNACQASYSAFIKYLGIIPQIFSAAECSVFSGAIPKDSLVILISQSGESHEIELATEILGTEGVEFWGITNNPDSRLAMGASRVILMNAGEEVSSATKTYTATLEILYLMAIGDQEVRRQVYTFPEEAKAVLQTVSPQIADFAQTLVNKASVYFIGAGVHGPTCKQASLILMEKTFKHSQGWPISEFRHGPIEVIEPGLPIVLTAVTSERRRELESHLEYFSTLGADVFAITDGPLRNKKHNSKVIQFAFQGEESLSHIHAILPYQLLAENLAVLRGLDVDGFRYISKVVAQY